MRSILVFLLILAGCTSDQKGAYVKNTFYPCHSKSYEGWKTSQVAMASLIFWPKNNFSNNIQEISSPRVEIVLSPETQESYKWNEYVRYSIDVSDSIDGASKYGEINESEVFLELEFLPIEEGEERSEMELKAKIKIAEKQMEHVGLSLIKNSTCFGCHADKTTHTGPSFSEITNRYENTPNNIASLSNSILEGSKGIWGSTEMPSNPDLTKFETEQIAKFILNQGAKTNNWIIPGLEGTFRIIEKPKNELKGLYILTASYTSTSKLRGQHSIILTIQ